MLYVVCECECGCNRAATSNDAGAALCEICRAGGCRMESELAAADSADSEALRVFSEKELHPEDSPV